MAINILQAVAALLATYARHMSRAAEKLRGAHRRKSTKPRRASSVILFLGNRGEKIAEEKDEKTGAGEGLEKEEEVWRRGIIMGEKCQPLDFSGVIYYDLDGRQVAGVPVLRSPMRSPLRTFLDNKKACK